MINRAEFARWVLDELFPQGVGVPVDPDELAATVVSEAEDVFKSVGGTPGTCKLVSLDDNGAVFGSGGALINWSRDGFKADRNASPEFREAYARMFLE
jgi:hypothetical protein